MNNFINRIKQFFKNIILRIKTKKLVKPEETSEKVIGMINSEIDLKKDKLNHNITELNILKIDNKTDEKNRIFELYKGIKNETIKLSEIDREDLLKIRKLLLEEAKMQDERFEEELRLLEVCQKGRGKMATFPIVLNLFLGTGQFGNYFKRIANVKVCNFFDFCCK